VRRNASGQFQILPEKVFMLHGIILDLIPGISIGNARCYCDEKDIFKLMFLRISGAWVFDSL
jgi:hypothetical protein